MNIFVSLMVFFLFPKLVFAGCVPESDSFTNGYFLEDSSIDYCLGSYFNPS